MKKVWLALLLPLSSCAQQSDLWRLEIPSEGGIIPLHIQLENQKAFILNANEKMPFDKIETQNDSLHLKLDLYDLRLTFLPKGSKASGYLLKKGTDGVYRKANFTATKGDNSRFKNPKNLKPATLGNKYAVTFDSGTKETPAIGVFETKGNLVTGSFLTPTGDYRFLQGNIIGDSLFLSALGNNASLYKVKIKGDSLVGGSIYSPFGKSSTFKGKIDPNASLDDADKLTFLKPGVNKFDFQFPDKNGEIIQLSDPKYKGKVTVVQLLGSWCPNCLDETKFLLEYRKQNPNLEVIGLAFERSADPAVSYPKIDKFVEKFGVDYPVVLAGSIPQASEKLPQLNHVMAFPTSIIVDKKGNVRKIHTGFSGPGTGKYYEDYVKEFSEFVTELEKE